MGVERTYKVLVCGSRDYEDWERIFRVLDKLHARVGPGLLIILGGATGADEWAREWAVSRRVDHHIMYARWGLEGKSAGPRRNQRMVREEPELVLAFSHDFSISRGTRNMISLAEAADVEVELYH